MQWAGLELYEKLFEKGQGFESAKNVFKKSVLGTIAEKSLQALFGKFGQNID